MNSNEVNLSIYDNTQAFYKVKRKRASQISIFDHDKIQKTIVKSTPKQVCWNRWKIDNNTKEKLIEYYNTNKYPNQNELKILSDHFDTSIKKIKTFFQNRRQRSKINKEDGINFEDKLYIDDEYIESVYDYHEENIILQQFYELDELDELDKELQFRDLKLEYNELHYISIFSKSLDDLYKIKFKYIVNLNLDDELKLEHISRLNLEYIQNYSIIKKNVDKYLFNILNTIIK